MRKTGLLLFLCFFSLAEVRCCNDIYDCNEAWCSDQRTYQYSSITPSESPEDDIQNFITLLETHFQVDSCSRFYKFIIENVEYALTGNPEATPSSPHVACFRSFFSHPHDSARMDHLEQAMRSWITDHSCETNPAISDHPSFSEREKALTILSAALDRKQMQNPSVSSRLIIPLTPSPTPTSIGNCFSALRHFCMHP